MSFNSTILYYSSLNPSADIGFDSNRHSTFNKPLIDDVHFIIEPTNIEVYLVGTSTGGYCKTDNLLKSGTNKAIDV